MDGEAVPLRAQSHEQIVQDGVRSDPGLAAGHIRVALRLIPVDVRAHCTKNGRDVSTAKCIVEILHEAYVVHASLLRLERCCPSSGTIAGWLLSGYLGPGRLTPGIRPPGAYSGLTATLRNLITPAPCCSVIGPSVNRPLWSSAV